ncbi:MAG: carboxylating nicotinate-nucleotide diphosphorylase [Planctomycetes bacterium]|jgi:nicotinate-nucleotide pyrophosphorylase (carboxylating)|nr:carboxylating nicotinate-nucleotide diphosphorylase [Planctomycetota bacterium]
MTDPILDFQSLIDWAGGWPLDDDLERSIDEDLGRRRHDVTSEALLDRRAPGRAAVVARQGGTLCGAVLIREVILHASARVEVDLRRGDGEALQAGDIIAVLTGPLRDVLRVERTLLNYLTHLSGVATLTTRYVQAVVGTKADICDTRKTLPGLRWLQKYAVRCGGGTTHRIGLYDAVLIKDNHIAHIPPDELADRITDAVAHAKHRHLLKHRSPPIKFFEVEVDTLEQLARVLAAPIDIVLLDNMPPDVLRQAVAMRDRQAPKVQLEASGGVNLDTVRAIAEAGVDRISVGALTHSAPALDMGLDIEAQAAGDADADWASP